MVDGRGNGGAGQEGQPPTPALDLVETMALPPADHLFSGPRPDPRGANLLLHGDNRQTLAWLLENGYRGKVRLIYLDPPYDSGSEWTRRIRLRGGEGSVIGAEVAYRDSWAEGAYLPFMAERLGLLRDLLHPDGTLWLHCDHRRQGHLLLLLEDLFGSDCYLNTVIWRSQVARGAKVHARYFPRSAHFLHIFTRRGDAAPRWNPPRREIVMDRAEAAARFMEDDGGFFRTSHPGTYSFERLVELHGQGRIYAPFNGDVIVDHAQRRVHGSNGGNIGIKYYLEQRGPDCFVATRAVDNIWDDIPGLGTIPSEDVNYPTQKTEGLLRRIVETASAPGDWVLDGFVGSGTSVVVAQSCGRRWIGCDDNWSAIRTTAGRLLRLDGAPEQDGTGTQVEIRRVPGIGQPGGRGEARVVVVYRGDGLEVAIEGFAAPHLARRIAAEGASPPADWRALVQAVLIDPNYDGRVFRVALADVPGGKEEMVAGRYRIAAGRPTPGRGVAVRLVAVTGWELLVVVPADAIIAP